MFFPLLSIVRAHTERLLRIDPETKPEVYLQIFEASQLANLSYWLELFLYTAFSGRLDAKLT